MTRFLPIPLVLTLAVPALADGAIDMLLLIFTGGPLSALSHKKFGVEVGYPFTGGKWSWGRRFFCGVPAGTRLRVREEKR